MKNKILFIVLISLIIWYVKIRSFEEETSFFNNEIVTVLDTKTGVTESVELENYLIGVVAGEMPASFNIEALKAQAVAARSYAYYLINNGMTITNDSSTQVYLNTTSLKNKWGNDYTYYLEKIKQAIKETQDEVVTYEGKIVPTYYYSMSNGFTESALNVFGEDREYLTKVESMEDATNRNFKVQTTIDRKEFCNILDINCDAINISNIIKNDSERVQTININEKVFSGIELRKLLNLRSTDFSIEITNDNINIITYGHGHGVGMSQYGANTMANEGYSYKDILLHYYVGVNIENISSIN